MVRAGSSRLLWLTLLLVCLSGSLAAQSVTKTAPGTVNAGATVNYSIEVTNDSGGSLSNISIQDTFPSLVSYVSASGTNWACTESGGVVTCTLSGSLADGASSTLALTGTAGAPAEDTVTTNTVNLLVNGTQEATDSANTTVTADADLTLDKSIVDGANRVNALTVRGGDAVAFAVSVTNTGPSPARTLQVRDTLPAGFSFVSGIGTNWSCTAASAVVTCTYGVDLAASATAPELVINTTSPIIDGTRDNTATARSIGDAAGTFPFPSDTVTVTLFREADLRVTKSASPASVLSGQPISYTYQVTNNGPASATNLTLTDVFDRAGLPGTPIVTAGAANWSCVWSGSPAVGESQLDCSAAASLPATAGSNSTTFTVQITAPTVNSTITLGNQATVNADEALPTPANNSSQAVSVEVVPAADLSLTARTSPAANQSAESVFAYNVQVNNAGPSTANSVVLTDTVPAGALIRSASGTGWSCDINQVTGTYRCLRSTLDSGASSTVTVSTQLPRNPPTAGTLSGPISSGTASVSSATADPDSSNNSDAPFSVTVAAVWDLSIEKTASSPVVVPGQSFQYFITVDNLGPSDLSGGIRPALSDDFDANLRGGLDACGVGSTVPCWQCESAPRLTQLSVLDSDVTGLTGISGARQIAVTPDRSHAFVAGRFDGSIAVLTRATARAAGFGELTYSSFNGDATAPSALAVHPGGGWLVSADAGSAGSLWVQSFDSSTSVLGTATAVLTDLDGAADLEFNADGDVLYIAESGSDRIRIVAFDSGSGAVSAIGQVTRNASGPNPVLLDGVSRLALSSNGSYLYAAGTGDNALVGFLVDGATGNLAALSTASVQPQVGGQPIPFTALATSPAGGELYAGGGSRVLVYTVNPSGLLGSFEATSATAIPAQLIDGVSDLVVSPDGNSVFVTATNDSAVSVFTRDAMGDMVFQRSQTLPDNLLANGLAIDAFGETVHVVASSSDPTGSTEPDRSLVFTFSTAPTGGCEGVRPGDVVSGDITDLALNLPVGKTVTVVVDAGLSASISSTIEEIDNVASLVDAASASSSDNALIEVRNATEVAVSLTAPGQRPVPGTEFAYTIEITNDGPGNLTGLAVLSEPPIFGGANTTGFVSGSLEWQCEATGNACCTSGGTPAQCGQIQPTPFVPGALSATPSQPNGHRVDMPSDSTLTFTLRGDLDSNSVPGADLTSEVQLTMPAGIDPFLVDDLNDSLTVVIDSQADLYVIKESLGVVANTDPPVVEYLITVGNSGPSNVAGLTLSDPLNDPSDPVFDVAGSSWTCQVTDPGADASRSCCSYSGSACTATDIATPQSGAIAQTLALANGAEAQFILFAPVTATGVAAVQNTASVAAPVGVTDDDATNDDSTAQARLLSTANLMLNKQILGGTTQTPGEQVQFVINLESEGPDDVPVVVQDLLPPDLDNVTWSCEATTPIPGDLTYSFFPPPSPDVIQPVDVVTSTDGRHVYVLAAGGEFTAGEITPASLIVYERNVVPGPNFGQLTEIDLEIDGVNDDDDSGLAVESLADARALALSPDQRHLYVASGTPGAVVVFRRDVVSQSETFGHLTFVEARENGSNQPVDQITPVSGLGGATAVRVSQDGGHVYVAAREENAVAIFRRDSGTGVLSFQGKVEGPLGLFDPNSPDPLNPDLLDPNDVAFRGALSIDIPPEDDFVYVTSRGPVNLFSGANWTSVGDRAAEGTQSYFVPNTPGIAVKYLELEQVAPVVSTTDLTLSFKHIYSLDWATSCYDVGVLEISRDGGATWDDVLALDENAFVTGGYGAEVQNGLEGNPLNGRPGWCRNSPGWSTGTFTDVEVDLSGISFPNGTIMIRFGLGEGTSFGNPGWWIDDIRLFNGTSPGGDIIADGAEGGSGGASITVLSRITDDTDANYGDLAPADFLPLPNGANLATMDASGLSYYVGSADDQSISHFSRVSGEAGLNLVETVRLTASIEPPISADSLSGLAAIEVSGDGEHLIASGAAVDRLVVFRRSPLSGELEAQQELELGEPANDPVNGGIVGVRGIAFSSDGQQVFTVTSNNQLGVFARRAPDPTFGFLEAIIDGQDDGFTSEASGLLGARATAVSDDGRFVFVASFGQIASPQSGALVVLERDAGSTEPGRHLRFRQSLRNNIGGVTGMDGAIDLTVVDQDIYVAAERSNAVNHFRQDPTTGVVTFIASYVNGGGITGMSGAAAVIASPNGQQVYVAGRFDHAVAIFSRDPVSGALSFVGEARNGEDGVVGMLGANAMAMSVDGEQLYVAARESNAVVVLDRDGDTLAHRQTFFDGTDGAVLTSPTGIAVTNIVANRESTSEHVLVTSLDGNAVTVLKRLTDPTQPDLLGNIRFQQALIDGVNGVDGLRSPRGIVVDPSNDRVYVVSDDDDALVIFDRNTSPSGALFGNLAPLEIRRLGVGGVIGLDRPYGVAVSQGARRNIYVASLGGQSLTAFVRRSGSSCPAAGSGNLSEEVLIAAGGTVQFVITGTINPGAEDPLNNTATLEDVVGDPINNTGDTSASSPEAILVPRSELAVDKDNNQLSIVAGETTNYRIVVSNDGPSHARGVRIRDLLSANPQFDENSAVWSCTAVGTGLLDREETRAEEGTSQAGLLGASGVVWTPAANPLLTERVYVTGVLGDALAVFSIDPVSGVLVPETALSLIEGGSDAGTDPIGDPVSGMRGARAVASSSTGDNLYIVSQVDNSILVVDVSDDATGSLDIVQVLDDSMVNLEGLDQLTDVVVSGDDANVYVAASNSNAIYVFDRLPNGQLSYSAVVNTDASILIGGVSDLLMGPEDRHLYAAGTNDSAVAVFERDATGDLTHIQTRSSPSTPGLGGVTALAFDADGEQLYALARDDESIVVFNRNNDDTDSQFGRLLSGVNQRIDRTAVPDLISPRDIVVSPDGSAAYVSSYGRNALLVFNRDRDTGQLDYITRYVDGSDEVGLTGASALAISPSGSELVATALLDDSVTRFTLSGFSRCTVDTGTGDVDLLVDIAAQGEVIIDLDVAVRPEIAPDDGAVSCPAPLDPERSCVVNTADVEWTQGGTTRNLIATDASFLDRATNLIISKNDGLAEFRGLAGATAIDGTDLLGGHVYVAAPNEPGIGVYALEEVVGAPTGDYPVRFVEVLVSGEDGVSQLNGISDVLVSPDGRHVYASSALDSAVVAFERTPISGELTIQAIYRNNNGGVSGLSGPRAMTMDSSGRFLYVAAENANSVVVFARQNDSDAEGFGDLTWQASVQNGTDGVQDMIAPVHLTLSPDDRHIYVAAPGSNAVTVLRREVDENEPDFGNLTWIQSRRNLTGNVVGLLGVSRVLVSPDGEFVYAAGTGNNAVVVFDRISSATDNAFGRLTFIEAAVDGNGFSGLAGASDLALLGANASLLAVTSPDTNTVALLGRDIATGSLGFLGQISEGDVQAGPVVVDGLVGANALFALPGESRLYAASSTPGAIVALDENGGQYDFAGSVIQGDGGAVPGEDVVYVIEVVNEGPSRVENARVTDIFPPQFQVVSWECSFGTPILSSCPSSGTGNIDVLVDIDAGDTLTFVATAQLRSDASGVVTNRATVTVPPGVVDLDPSSSEAVDDDTVVRARSDLAVTFAGLPATLVAGADLTYQLNVENIGSSDSRGARVEHRLPEAFGQTAWVCEADREPGTLSLQPSPLRVLDVTRASAISGDGRHVYVTGDTDSGVPALVVYSRNTISGELQNIQLVENLTIEPDPDGDRVIDGLAGARALSFSSDDRFLYVLGYADDAIAVFERDLATGELTFLQVVRDNIGVVDGLGGAIALALSDDEQQIYVAGQLDNAIAVFDRDATSGQVSFVQVLRNGSDGVQDLSFPSDLLVTDSDGTVLVASSGADALLRFDRGANGQLTFADSIIDGQVVEVGVDSFLVDGLGGVRSMVLSDDGRWLYTYGRTGIDQVLGVFERPAPDQLVPTRALRENDPVGVPPVPLTGLVSASGLELTEDGQQLYLAGLDDLQASRSLAAFRILEGADLQFLGRFDGSAADSPGALHSLTVSADGRHLYSNGAGFENTDVWQLLGGSICGRAGEVIVLDAVDLEAGGVLTYEISTNVLANARGEVTLDAVIDPATAREDTNLANNVDSQTLPITVEAELEVIKTRSTDPIVAGEPVTWDIVINNNGPSSLLGVDVQDALPALPGALANPMAPGVVSGSAQWICLGDDHLDPSQTFASSELAGARGVAISPDGLWAAAASQTGDSLTLYQRNPATGALVQVDQVVDGDDIVDQDEVVIGVVSGLDGAFDVAFSPDQAHLVVASADSNALAVFALDADNSALEFVESKFDEPPQGEPDEVFDLNEPVRVRFSPDGERVLFAARGSNAMTVFTRQAVSGRLTWLESWRSGLDDLPLNALDGISDLVFSPDGAFIYVAATENDSIGIFRRDGAGNISWVESLSNGQAQPNGSVVGLGLVQSLAISPKGRHLYAVSLSEDSLTLFERDETSGLLELTAHYRDGVNGFESLDGANGVIVSPDGENVIVSARNDASIAVFSRDWSDGRVRTIEIESDPALFDVRRMSIAPDGGSLLVSSGAQTGTVINLRRQAEGYCGLDTSTADELIDTVDVAAGGTLRYQVEALVHPGARGVLENTVSLTAPPNTVVLPGSQMTDTESGPITVVSDLSVVKTIDGDASSLIGGGLVRFVLDITNDGPSHAFGASLQDVLPPSIVGSFWTCQPLPSGSSQSVCPVSGSGDLDEIVDVVAGERLLVIIDAQIASDFLGQITNTAVVTESIDSSDPDQDNNSSTVTATVSAVADVAIAKLVNPTALIAGELVEFTLLIDNFGPSDAQSVTYTDILPPEFVDPQWTCVESGGAVCPTVSGIGDVIDTVALPSGGRLEYRILAQVDPFLPPATLLTNEADVVVSGTDVSDPDLGNNSAFVELAVVGSEADLSVRKTASTNNALPGDAVSYEIVVANAGPSGSLEARIIDLMPPELINVTWSCQATGGAVCPVATGSDDIDLSLSFPPDSGLVIDVQAEIDPAATASPDTRIINRVEILPVEGAIDPELGNNQAAAVTVLDLDVMFRDRFEGEDALNGEGDQ
ncbi:hypothetical protein AY599_24015 [Leptolyngbya valderiana BDU 20041]|nr:hypothetical protein AY599_24015 [Leptolyngbya valderiana BDU 20041]